MLGCRGLLLQQQHQQQHQQLQLQRRRFEKLCRRRPQVDRALCQWALGRGARLHTPHLRLHGSGGHLYARKAIEVGGSKKRLLFTVPMTTSIGLTDPSSPDGDGPGGSSEWAASSAPDSSSLATTSGTAHARALEEWLALSRATLTASLVDNDPRHVFAKAFVDRAFARVSASGDFAEDDFVDEDDDDDAEAQQKKKGNGSTVRLHHRGEYVHGTSAADCAVYTTTLSDARYPAACVFADRMQRAVASAMLSSVQGVAPLVRPTMAAVLQAAVVDTQLPFELVPFVDRIDPAALATTTTSSDANVKLSCFVDAHFEPHFKVMATMDIAAGERLRVDLQCPGEGKRGEAAVTAAAAWAGMSAAEQEWVRFGRRPPEPPLHSGTEK